MRKTTFPILLIGLALVAFPWSAGAISSTSYQLFPEQGFNPSADGSSTDSDMLESASFQVQGSVDAFSGRSSSTSYQQDGGGAFQYYCGDGFIDPGETCDGASLNSASCVSLGYLSGTLTCNSSCTGFVTSACTAAGGGGGGGGGGGSAPSAPTVAEKIKSYGFSYQPTFFLYGSNDTLTTGVKVNESTEGVSLPSTTSWQKTISLSFGLNSFKLVATNSYGSSPETVYQLYRRLVGDMTQDNTVNDYDLSKLVKLWGGTDRTGDFNVDGSVNDYDFSMMVARWGTKV